MKISHSIVRIKKIVSSKPRTDFSETELDEAARLILEMEGVVMPLILLRTEPESESYSVIDGHFEYYAALRAREIDSRKGNTINAYIVESEEEKSAYEQQIKLFRQRLSVLPTAQEVSPIPPPDIIASKINTPEESPIPPPDVIASKINTPEVSPIPPPDIIASKINTPEESPIPPPDVIASKISPSERVVSDERFAALEQIATQLVAKNDALEKTVGKLAETKDNGLHDTLEMLKHFIGEQLNNISVQIEQKVSEQIKVLGEQMKNLPVPETPKFQEPTPVAPTPVPTQPAPPVFISPPKQVILTPPAGAEQEDKFLEAVNTLSALDLIRKLERMRVNKKVKDNIINERDKQPFHSIENMVERVSGLGDKTMKKILAQFAL